VLHGFRAGPISAARSSSRSNAGSGGSGSQTKIAPGRGIAFPAVDEPRLRDGRGAVRVDAGFQRLKI